MKVEKEYLAKNLENIFMKMIYKLKFINCGIRNYSNNNSIIFLGEWRQWLEPGPSRPLMELIFSGTPDIVLVVKNFIHTWLCLCQFSCSNFSSSTTCIS